MWVLGPKLMCPLQKTHPLLATDHLWSPREPIFTWGRIKSCDFLTKKWAQTVMQRRGGFVFYQLTLSLGSQEPFEDQVNTKVAYMPLFSERVKFVSPRTVASNLRQIHSQLSKKSQAGKTVSPSHPQAWQQLSSILDP